MKKRVSSLLLALVLLVSLLPLGTLSAKAAESNAPTISVESVEAFPGSTVTVNVDIKNNPGILGAKLTLSYGEGLTLTAAASPENNAFGALSFTKPGKLASPCNFVWDGTKLNEEDIKDGSILTLTFQVSDGVQEGQTIPVELSYAEGDIVGEDIVGGDLKPVTIKMENSGIKVINYILGDVNRDKVVTPVDLIMLRRHLAGGYDNLNTDTLAADVDKNGVVNVLDLLYIRRHIAGGYSPCPLCPTEHAHPLEATAYKAATCTQNGNIAYWHCKTCDKYFSNEEGTAEITQEKTVIPATGHTPNAAGTACATCGASLTGKYKVQFNCGMIDPSEYDLLVINKNAEGTDKMMYSSSEDTVLPTLHMDTYTFVGWSDQTGRIYQDNIIPAGTTGNLILKDNWISQRNRAKPKTTLDKPLVVEDTDNQVIYFGYEIGTIENVPLYTTQELQCVNGIITIIEKNTTHNISKEEMQSLESTIAKKTTDSTQVTLSKELTDITEVTSKSIKEYGYEKEAAEEHARSQSKTQSVSNSVGGSSEKYVYNDSTVKNSTNQNYVVNKNFDTGVSFELETGFKNTTEASAGLSFPIDIISVNAGIKNTTEVSANTDTKAYMDYSVGTSKTWNKDTYASKTQVNSQTDSKNWNSTSASSYTGTEETSQRVSEAFHEMISNEYGYGKTYSETNGSSEQRGYTEASSKSSQSKTEYTYTEQTIKSETKAMQTTGHTYGNYRLVMAGTMHVFAVVGYDVAKGDYFVYTYNILGDGTQNDGWHEMIDYTYDRSFQDHENTVMPFEIPYYVEEYVNSRIVNTKGLEYSYNNQKHTAIVEKYNGTDEVVYVPSYAVDEHGTAYKVTGIKAGAFQGNENIVAVSLGRYISEIPQEAFKDCTALENVICPAVTSIGDRAFQGCTSLNEFTVSKQITNLGENVFDGVKHVSAAVGYDTSKMEDSEKLEAEKTMSEVTAAVAASGAKSISLDISNVPKDVRLDLQVASGDEFELTGEGKEFANLTLVSHADTTKIKRILLQNYQSIPLKIYSENVELYAVDILDCKSLGLLFGHAQTKLTLSGTNTITSKGENAAILKSATVSFANSGRLNVSGDILCVNGVNAVSDPNGRIYFDHGEYKAASQEDFEKYEKGAVTVTFDANGGEASENSRQVYLGEKIAQLPSATRAYYTFDGWYTERNGGTRVTENQPFTEDTTLYAHWKNGWTAWSDTEPPEDYTGEVETREVYSYRTKSTTTSSSTLGAPWVLYNTTSAWGPYGGWSGWSTSPAYASDSTQVETRTGYYYYYYVCPSCGKHNHGWGTGACYTWAGGCGGSIPESAWHEYYSATPYSSTVDYHGTSRYYVYAEEGLSFCVRDSSNSYYRPPVTQYRYQSRSKVYTYYYYKWSDWSAWTTTEQTASDTREVQSKTQYRYLDAVENQDKPSSSEAEK